MAVIIVGAVVTQAAGGPGGRRMAAAAAAAGVIRDRCSCYVTFLSPPPPPYHLIVSRKATTLYPATPHQIYVPCHTALHHIVPYHTTLSLRHSATPIPSHIVSYHTIPLFHPLRLILYKSLPFLTLPSRSHHTLPSAALPHPIPGHTNTQPHYQHHTLSYQSIP